MTASTTSSRPEEGIQRSATRHRASSAWSIMHPVKRQIGYAMGLSVTSSLLGLLCMGLLTLTVKALLERPQTWPWELMLGVLACTVTAYLTRLGAFNQAHFAAFRLERILRMRLCDRLARVSMGYVQAQGAGALTKVIHDDVRALHVFVADSTPLYARAYVTPVVTFCVLMWLDWRLALGTLGVLILGFGVLRKALRRRGEMVRLYNDARERVSSAIVEFVQAMPVVRTFDTGHSTFGRYQQALTEYLDVLTRWYRESGVSARFSWVVLSPMLTLIVVLWLGTVLTQQGDLDPVRWLAVLLLCTGMAEAVMPMMMLRHMVDKVKLSIARIHDVMAAPCLPTPSPDVEQRPRDASVRFENVSFRYTSTSNEALNDISFTAAPGTVTALVGPSGAGKSSVAKLILRFWDVSEGRVLVGGVDVRDMTSNTLMHQVSFVFQDTFLFSDSIADNIRLGMYGTDMDSVIAAAKAAQAHDFIMELPDGYDTRVGERGIFLSGGQRQRITIARAILQNRPILVLDEATAFADPENEAALVSALSQLMQGKTVIMVAHRLATIRDADLILVLDEGHLIESGRHQVLVERGGTYARLWHSYEMAQHWSLGQAGQHTIKTHEA
ncbi:MULTISPECIES: ABC transporter ATP-binding protein [unclassified Modicisalibacter]|uniref:ABC transporter ATP-binding protein n=1 Tax=unclassified Modicisalibacter TaxID=2679913 RepID=UPI001CCCEF57|nr:MULTISPECIES: ABC transporter ATP-binding protein [unclassified Modicisalibacter]MBZ9558533.1 ABC transporter ATP-binding protein [Modicisalibacter sp. R2A 31.J]MBZ9575575.1 ABC transporter ATP-binding protein [Modicisalibacter sp. MOD 31.J]